LRDTTLTQYLYDLDRRLDRILSAAPSGKAGHKLVSSTRYVRFR
jgi:hypothetical protein